MDAGTGLAGLFLSSFLSATLLPGSSEIALVAFIRQWPESVPTAIGIATIGNTLGGLTTYLLCRFLPRRELPRHLHWVQRWGPLALLGSWLPVVGDALCAGAGWLRLNAVTSTLCMLTGKLTRYVVLAVALG
ncbi:MAG: YqaA family protein [Burkholderiales bacterium]